MGADPEWVNKALAQIQKLESEGAENVRRQHVVSRVLLDRFTEPQPGGKKLYPFDMEHPNNPHSLKGTGGVGWNEEFVPYASKSLEELWAGTEQLLPPVFAALDNGTIFQNPTHVDLLRDLLALHLVRSHRYRTVHEQSFVNSFKNTMLSLVTDHQEAVQTLVLATKGLHLAGPEGLAHYAAQILKPSTDLFSKGQLLRVRIEELYADFRKFIAQSGVQIITPQAGEFLIGDNPANTIRREEDRISYGVSLADATTAVLPLGPRHTMALSPHNEIIEVPEAHVADLNMLQVLTAQKKVFLRPGSGLDEFVRLVCRSWQTTKGTPGVS